MLIVVDFDCPRVFGFGGRGSVASGDQDHGLVRRIDANLMGIDPDVELSLGDWRPKRSIRLDGLHCYGARVVMSNNNMRAVHIRCHENSAFRQRDWLTMLMQRTGGRIDAERGNAMRAFLTGRNNRADDAIAPSDVQELVRRMWPSFLNTIREHDGIPPSESRVRYVHVKLHQLGSCGGVKYRPNRLNRFWTTLNTAGEDQGRKPRENSQPNQPSVFLHGAHELILP